MPLSVLAHGDVANCRGHQNSLGAFEGAQHDLDGKLGPILSPPDELNSRPDLLRQCLGCGTGSVGDQPLRETLQNNALHLLAYQLIAAISKLAFRLDIQEHNLSILIDDYHRIRGRLEQTSVPGLHLHQVLLIISAYSDIASRSCNKLNSPPNANDPGENVFVIPGNAGRAGVF